MKTKPNEVDAQIGARIRSRRMQIGKSQEWLGDQVGVTFQQIQKYERGWNGVRGSRMQQIASALSVPASYFYKDVPGGTDVDNDADKALRAFTTSRDGLKIVAAWDGLKPKLRGIFAELCETMSEA